MQKTGKQDEILKVFNKYGLNPQRGVVLANYTCTRVGGKATYFLESDCETTLVNAYKIALETGIPFLVLGGGSNVLVSDDGFNGLVVLNKASSITAKGRCITATSGVRLFSLVKYVLAKKYVGMEKLIGIPGTVGGAVYGNAGAFGQSTSDRISRVKVFDGQEIHWLSKDKCAFSYRDSIFKKTKPLILAAEFKFGLSQDDDLENNAEKLLTERNKKYSMDLKCPGSFFKNVEVSNLSSEIIAKIPKDKIVFGKIPAGYLLEEVGAKGMKAGGVVVSDFHSNLFLNQGRGKAQDYITLSTTLKDKVLNKFGILLEEEVQMIGFNTNYSLLKNNLTGKKIAVLGLGLEGRDLIKYLLNTGSEISILDQKKQKDLDLTCIDKRQVRLICGYNYLFGLEKYDIVFRSPGVYRYLDEIMKAERKGVVISSAIQLFFELCPAKIIGVTGTKGKGTTSTLIYEILKKDKKSVYLAGNIGKPILELLPKLTQKDWVVLELSSFQLIDLKVSPHIAVILNITLDHMDWHKDKKEYLKAKTNIVAHQKRSDFAIINHDYKTPMRFNKLGHAQKYYFSRKGKVNGVYVLDNKIYLSIQGNKNDIYFGKVEDLQLRGEHNWENITAAALASYLAGVKIDSIKKTIFTFKGLEHRLELVSKVDGISFYNDSFATGPQPTMAAINSFHEPITLILGGYDKGLNYSEMGRLIAKKQNIRNVILIGNLSKTLKGVLLKSGYKGVILDMDKPSMSSLVNKTHEITPKGGLVLLSPAAASFDMFKDYKDRGNQFKMAVNQLTKNIK